MGKTYCVMLMHRRRLMNEPPAMPRQILLPCKLVWWWLPGGDTRKDRKGVIWSCNEPNDLSGLLLRLSYLACVVCLVNFSLMCMRLAVDHYLTLCLLCAEYYNHANNNYLVRRRCSTLDIHRARTRQTFYIDMWRGSMHLKEARILGWKI